MRFTIGYWLIKCLPWRMLPCLIQIFSMVYGRFKAMIDGKNNAFYSFLSS
jgi:hypothetical protein